MLTNIMRTAAAALGMAFFVLSLHATPAAADVDCDPIPNPDGTFILPCEDEVGGDGGGSGEGNGGGSGDGDRTCNHLGREVPCSSSYGAWNGRCYERVMNPQPPKDAPQWRGNDDGLIVECTPFQCAEHGGDLPNCPGYTIYWSPDAPAPVGPSAEELARRAVATMQLTMGQIGSTPPSSASSPGTVGTVGLPIWLWIANRAANNAVGPITRTASDGGLTVTARGTLDHVEWALTDANGVTVGAITCDGANAAGTPYDGRNSAEPSPTCGFGADLNRAPGNLTLTGTAHWSVEWQGGDQTGQIVVTPPSKSAPLRIGELQALVQN